MTRYWTDLIEPQIGMAGPFAGQVFLTAQGHVVQDSKQDLTIANGAGRILQLWFDMQVNGFIPPKVAPVPEPGSGFMQAVRYYLDTKEIEAVTISASENKVRTDLSMISRRSFVLPKTN